jgi:hypothetical protein
MNMCKTPILPLACLLAQTVGGVEIQSLNLNGDWEVVTPESATRQVVVPGVVNDPSQMDVGPVRLRRPVRLPEGDWTHATVLLKGARYNPTVYVDGERVSSQQGGMQPTEHPLEHPAVAPANTITLEIELMSLRDLSEENASYIPTADHWRSTISSMLWDDVDLLLHGEARIDRMIPFTDIHADKADFHVYAVALENKAALTEVKAELLDEAGGTVASGTAAYDAQSPKTVVSVPFGGKLSLWSPDEPNLYRLRISLLADGEVVDRREYPYGAKEFKLDESGKQFLLNGKTFTARAATVVWPRWVRNPEGYALAWNEDWFERNIVLRMKDLGANTLRFHLGNPPEEYIDLCDRHGLLVQYEWHFFHGMPASEESLLEQWPAWFDLGLRHPSVALFHPYNETDDHLLVPAWAAIDKIIVDYPPIILADRDVIHIHKYWWSLFENLGLYYDSYTQFPKAIMVDEFGGNYLDANYDYGLYKTVKDTFRRFLGPGETKEQRIKLQTQANVKVAEYWRRLGAAGFSPFCALGSHEDGSHWFEGDLSEGNPKPVWNALAVAFSPIAASLELWDQNFTGGQSIEVPVYLFNDTDRPAEVRARITVEQGKADLFRQDIVRTVAPFSREIVPCEMTLPVTPGDYWVKATLLNDVPQVKHPVVSKWDIRVLEPKKAPELDAVVLGIPEYEKELIAFADAQGLKHVRPVPGADFSLLMLSRESWNRIEQPDETLKALLSKSVNEGRSALLLDVGTQFLGQGYPENEGELGPLQGSSKITEQKRTTTHVFGSVSLVFAQAAEPESHLHAHQENSVLWNNLAEDDTWLWNGYRGGLIVPADTMEVLGLSRDSFFNLWVERGADGQGIRNNPDYTAYALEGSHAFSTDPEADQEEVIQGLRDHVRFIQQDAPAIAAYINPGAPVEITALNEEYSKLSASMQRKMVVEPMAVAGKGLRKVPVVWISFGDDSGSVIVSQLLTQGRLAKGFGRGGLYGVRYDPAAVQMVLNMIQASLVR